MTKGFLVCLVSELMLASGLLLQPFFVLESGVCRVIWCSVSTLTAVTGFALSLIYLSALGFAIGLGLVWHEATRGGAAG